MPVAFPLGPQAPTPSARKTYRVRINDTIASIAKQFGVSDAELMAANPAVNSITPGVALIIPAAAYTKPYTATPMQNAGPGGKPGWQPAQGNWITQFAASIRNWYNARPDVGWNARVNPSSYTATGWNQMANTMPPGTATVVPPATIQQQPQGYQPTGWNAIANQPVAPSEAGKSYNLPPGLSQRQIDEYAQNMEWFARDPNRVAANGGVPTYEEFTAARYAGGGGDFWQYMQDIQGGDITTASGTGSSRRKNFGRYKNNYPQVGVPENNSSYYNNYPSYYRPTAFGVVTWRGW